jgi:Protein of unknown function (DUF4199)
MYGDRAFAGRYLAPKTRKEKQVNRIVLTFGIISGLISAAMLLLGCALLNGGQINLKTGQVVGYTAMVFSFLLVFFGIRSYRHNVGGGAITFGRAVAVGLLITLISTLLYVVTWEIIYFNFLPDFADKMTIQALADMRADGATEAEIAVKQQQMERFKVWYKNPILNAAITFIEPFPVGLIMTLISAAILRRKTNAPSAATALA